MPCASCGRLSGRLAGISGEAAVTSARPRRGLVLGGGGVLGGTWAIGALLALEERLRISAESFDVILGTSAGSVIAALIGGGVSADQLRQHYNAEPVSSGPLAGYSWDPVVATGGPRPGVPRLLGPGSARLIGNSLIRPGRMPMTAVISAFLPLGATSLDRIGHLVEAVTPPGEWSDHPAVWVVAMDYEAGRRVVFGRPGAPIVPLASAVMASCAIPGWFAPVRINGRSYVDGGAWSSTSVDALAHAGLDEVYVIAPMASIEVDRPGALLTRLERRWRQEVAKECRREADVVAATGTCVHVIGPGPEDLAAMGANMMDASRRAQVLQTSIRTSTAAWARNADHARPA